MRSRELAHLCDESSSVACCQQCMWLRQAATNTLRVLSEPLLYSNGLVYQQHIR